MNDTGGTRSICSNSHTIDCCCFRSVLTKVVYRKSTTLKGKRGTRCINKDSANFAITGNLVDNLTTCFRVLDSNCHCLGDGQDTYRSSIDCRTEFLTVQVDSHRLGDIVGSGNSTQIHITQERQCSAGGSICSCKCLSKSSIFRRHVRRGCYARIVGRLL